MSYNAWQSEGVKEWPDGGTTQSPLVEGLVVWVRGSESL